MCSMYVKDFLILLHARAVLEAGLKAPSHNHLRQWEFILVKDVEQRMKVAELAQRGKSVENEMELEKMLDNFADPVQREMYRKAIPVQAFGLDVYREYHAGDGS